MANLIDLLQEQLSEGMVEQLANQIGGADKNQTAAATSAIIEMITSALAKNSANLEGAGALTDALERDHDGSILEDLMGYATGKMQNQATNNNMLNGAGILKHILGGKQDNAADIISQMSGLAKGQTGNLMAMLAPIIMGMLGKQKKQQNMGKSDLSDFLNKSVQNRATQRKEMSIFEKFLDQDGDGNVMDDFANMGMKMLGKFLKR